MDINITNNVISNLGSNLSPARRTAGDSKAEISPANAESLRVGHGPGLDVPVRPHPVSAGRASMRN